MSLFVRTDPLISTCCIAPKGSGDETVLINVDRRIVDGDYENGDIGREQIIH